MQIASNDYTRPKTGKTARVWEIADELTKETGRRAKRKEVIQQYYMEGGNTNTASTQYSRWNAAFKKNRVKQAFEPKPGNVAPVRLTVGADGRLSIPVELRRAMMLDGASSVTARVVDGELRVLAPACAIRKLQNMIAQADKGSGSVVDELVEERRAEAKREAQV